MTNEEDILEILARHPRNVLVNGHATKYGDPDIERAAATLKSVPHPWTVSHFIHMFMMNSSGDSTKSAAILTVLASSREPRAAVVLASALDNASLDIRIAATYGLMNYFLDEPVSGGTEQHMEAVKHWWKTNKTKYEEKANSEIVSQMPPELISLMKADRLDSGVIGEGAASKLHAQYKLMRATRLPINCYLSWIAEKGSPAGRLWAASALLVRKPEDGKKALQALLNDKSTVAFQSGCEVFTVSVNEVASSLLKTGKYDDFTP